MLNLKTEDKGRPFKGHKAYTINLVENNLPTMRHEFNKLKGEQVTINGGKLKEIIGIEAFALGPDIEHRIIGIAVKPIQNELEK